MTALTPDQARLVAKYQNLVHGYVAKRIRRFPHLEHIREDMFQEGMLSLCKAVRNFDPNRGVTFGGYALQWVDTYSRIYERSVCNPVKAPDRGKNTYSKRQKAVYIERGEMPLHDPSHSPDPSDELDAAGLYARAREFLEDEVGEARADMYLKAKFVSGPTEVGKEINEAPSNVCFWNRQTGAVFEEWAEGVREEAA